eukprot:s9809_g2.t1
MSRCIRSHETAASLSRTRSLDLPVAVLPGRSRSPPPLNLRDPLRGSPPSGAVASDCKVPQQSSAACNCQGQDARDSPSRPRIRSFSH